LTDETADIRLAAKGDREAFDRLVLRHQHDVVSAATYYLGDYEDAVDVAQEAFLKAYRGLSSFRGKSSFKTWILRIALNTARSLRARRRAKKRGGEVVHLSPGTRDTSDGPAADVPDPDSWSQPATLLERKEVKEAIEKAITELDADSREIIVLRDITGESYEAIAAELSLPIGTVKSRVHRARLELRQKMERFF